MEHGSGGASSTAYWACQLAGWGGYGLGYYLAVLVPFHATGPKRILADAAYCATGLAGTHLLRLWMKQRGWSELGYARLAPRLMLGALLVGTLQTAALYGCLTLEGGMDWGQAPVLPIVGVTVFFSAFLVALWLAVYLGGSGGAAAARGGDECAARGAGWARVQAAVAAAAVESAFSVQLPEQPAGHDRRGPGTGTADGDAAGGVAAGIAAAG